MTTLDRSLSERRQELAATLAGELFGNRVPPVNPLSIAAEEGRRVRVAGDDFRAAFDGRIEYLRDIGQFLLLFNMKYEAGGDSKAPRHPRIRFSIAHELAHYFIDAHRSYLVGGGTPHGSNGEFAVDRIVEREADAFASALLMPTKAMRPIVNASELCLATVDRIATDFRVSPVAAAIRAVRLSDFPCAVAGLQQSGDVWLFCSTALIKAGCYPLPKAQLPSRSARVQLDLFRAGHAQQRASANSLVSEWFQTYARGGLDRVEVLEEYLPVPTMKTLIVILSGHEDDFFPETDDDE